jgi:hypothetical protein
MQQLRMPSAAMGHVLISIYCTTIVRLDCEQQLVNSFVQSSHPPFHPFISYRWPGTGRDPWWGVSHAWQKVQVAGCLVKPANCSSVMQGCLTEWVIIWQAEASRNCMSTWASLHHWFSAWSWAALYHPKYRLTLHWSGRRWWLRYWSI